MAKNSVITLDLNFQDKKQAIASYLISDGDAVVLIESGPGSTLAGLEAGLRLNGLTLADVTHILLTHIHLDHAGAAGQLSRYGAQIYVHPVGAPHLLDPEKLLASATRIYGDRMESLWGAFLPVEREQLHVVEDAQEIAIGSLRFVALSTPGHAQHHHVYLFEDICFSGDVGGVRIPGFPYLRVPMPPPELHLERWRATLARLRQQKFARIAPTHFGIFDDPAWHLREVEKGLDAAERWLEATMPADPPVDELRASFTAWIEAEGRAQGLDAQVVKSYGLANPLGMSADGLMRYWKKVRLTVRDE
jgi:glyoxylase-like metal-dependent hydrolase (beta-lactamase superfamily II)